MPFRPLRGIAPALLLAAAACGDTTQPTPHAASAAQLSIAAGDGQTGTPGHPLSAPLTVLAADSAGHPVQGVWVGWTVDAEAGHVSADSVRTGADGRASATWTLGGYIGEWTATARVAGLAPVVFHGTADGPVHVDIVHPAAGDTIDTALGIELQVTAEAPVAEVRLAVGARDISLLNPYSGAWFGYAGFDGVPAGPQRLRATARDEQGHVAMAVVDVVHDSPLRIRVLDPLGWVLAGRVPVRAACVDDNQNSCRSFEALVRVNGVDTRIAQAATDINITYPVADLAADSVSFVFHATDAGGRTTTVETRPFRVMQGPWTQIVGVPGTVLDASPDRAMYVNGDFLQLVNVRTGDDASLYAESSIRADLVGWVTAAGGIIEYGFPCCGKRSGVEEFGGSYGGASTGSDPRGRGGWAAWRGGSGRAYEPFRLNRDDVLNRSIASTPDSLAVASYDLADDGTIAFSARGQLFVWRGATFTQLTSDTAYGVSAPVTDGSAFLYLRKPAGSTDPARQLVYRGAGGGEEVLTPAAAPVRYGLLNGWAAFEYPDAAGAFHTFVRTPSGEVHAVWPAAPADTRFLSVGPQGQVVLASSGALYLSQVPHAAATPLGSWGTVRHVKWFDGKMYLVKDSGFFRYDGP
jgi:hypothetical protein